MVTNSASFRSATFSISLSLNENPPLDAAYWASLPRVRIRVQASHDRSDPFLDLIEGYCDNIHIHPISGSVVLEGRDLSSSLLDTKTFKNYQNLTPGEIAREIAKNHGLSAVFFAGDTYAGRLYGSDSTASTLAQFAKLTTDWDMLVMLAQVGGYDLFMSGQSIYFQPNSSPSGPIHTIHYADLIDLSMKRILPLTDGVGMTVLSWNSAQQEAITETFESPPTGRAESKQPNLPRSYTVMRPNLRSQTARALATEVARTVSREAMSIQFKMPADLTITARQHFTLSGTNTTFDRPFKTDWITRTFRDKSGFSQTVHATLAM